MSDRRRRRSLSVFRPPLTGLTPINEPPDSAPASLLHNARRSTAFFSTSPSTLSSEFSIESDMPSSSPATPTPEVKPKGNTDKVLPSLPKTRPRSLQKSGRPSSLFGSFRSIHGDQDDAHFRLTATPTSAHSMNFANDISGSQVLFHGEVQTGGGMFRKKNHYLVLTDTHLVRFKSRARASEVFPSIPSSLGRSSGSGIRHSRVSSSGSMHENQPTSSTPEPHHAIPLNHIVAVYKLDDGKPYFSVEVSHLDEETMHSSTMTLQLQDPRDSDLWLSSIRGAAIKARLTNPQSFSQRLVEYTARALEQERDYDPQQFHMFKVVKRANKSGSRSSSDDLSKLASTVCILAIGVYKIHLIPLPQSSKTASSTSLSDMSGASHGVTTLTSLNVQTYDDAFSLTFRIPLRQQSTLYLASSCVTDIALWIRQAADYLRPEWLEQPFTWNVPENLDNELLPVPESNEDHQAFDRTLTAYCAAYDIDTSRIRYAVNYQCEDPPAFELLPSLDQRYKYTVLELLAVMRALRYNESFGFLSFKNINLEALHKTSDPHGYDHVPWTTRSGQPLNQPEQASCTLLVQEIQALALKSKRLRRLDFSNCITGKSAQLLNIEQDPGCGICEALFPLCAKQLTNIDWITLNGILLSDVDLDYIFAATIDKSCHFRALDLGDCGLGDRSMQMVLHSLASQGATMESIDLSGNKSRLDPKIIGDTLGDFCYIRKLNFSNISRFSGPEPLLSAELLLGWKLEEIRLSKTLLNEETVDAIAVYLQSPQSDILRMLELDQCRLTGSDAATLFDSMVTTPGKHRNLYVTLNDNRLEQGHEALVNVIRRNHSPTHITMQSLEYKNEANYRKLVEAISHNTTIKYLDISKAALPSDANDETCQALYYLFARNKTLEYLDISGEQAHLEANCLGGGLNHALLGLAVNQTLKVLRIENQAFGLPGASALATVIEENQSLREIHCEGNEINLQAFTVIVNSMEHNTTVLFLPDMDADRAWARKKVDREVDSFRENNSGIASLSSTTKSTVKKTLGKTMSGQRSGIGRALPGTTQDFGVQAAQAAAESLSQNWDREVKRLREYLKRNYHITNGHPPEGPGFLHYSRPDTSNSLAKALEAVGMEKPPNADVNHQAGDNRDGQGDRMKGKGKGKGKEREDFNEAGDGLLEMSPRFRR